MSKKAKKKARAPKPTARGKKLKKLHPGKDFSKPVRKMAKQPRLPGMEDSAIQELEDAAREFAEIRDERAELGKSLAIKESELLDLMTKNDKDQYFHAGILIKRKPGSDKVNVRMNATKDPDAEEPEPPQGEQATAE
jgi:hypothetical protein